MTATLPLLAEATGTLHALGGLAPSPAGIPSPAQSEWHLGPIPIRAYALWILAGVVAAWFIVERRWTRRGAPAEVSLDVAVGAVLGGILGARIYHVVTLPEAYFGPGADPLQILRVWEGGLGIMGGFAGGALGAWAVLRLKGLHAAPFADALAPALPVAQAIGRLGNWFNQELYGRPTDLPWGLEIDPRHQPPGDAPGTLYHPTFLYEAAWNLTGAAVLVWIDRRWHLTHGRLFCLYLIWYGAGRTFTEGLRIDETVMYGPLRVNQVFSLATLLVGVLALVLTTLWARRDPQAGVRIWLPGREPQADPGAAPHPEPGSAPPAGPIDRPTDRRSGHQTADPTAGPTDDRAT